MHKLISRMTDLMAGAASIFLLALMLITFVDVVGRYFFDAPLVFTVEVIELGMGLMIFFGLALTTLKGGHIAVDLISGFVPRFVRLWLVSFSTLITVAFIGLMSWRLWDRALNFWDDGLATQILFLPVAPVVFLMAIAGGVTTVFAVYMLVHPTLFIKKD